MRIILSGLAACALVALLASPFATGGPVAAGLDAATVGVKHMLGH
jgi:hypothetical protein